jgi:hypothetical protein
MAITAYRPLVFNSTTLHPPAGGAVRAGFPALSLAISTRACAKKRDRQEPGWRWTPLFRTVLNLNMKIPSPQVKVSERPN